MNGINFMVEEIPQLKDGVLDQCFENGAG